MTWNKIWHYPLCFKDALKRGDVAFLEDPQVTFESFNAYRGIFRDKGGNFSNITFDDFLSYAELGKPYNPRYGRKDSYYSCSEYKNLDECKKALVFPNPKEDRQISIGPVCQEDGCIKVSQTDSHVDFWIYENHTDFWTQYKIV